MRIDTIPGIFSLILIPCLAIPQEVRGPEYEPLLAEFNIADATPQSIQNRKVFKDSSGLDELPRTIWSEKPVYPENALKEKAGGLVETKLYIDKQGTVSRVEITQSSGRQDLDDAAVSAAKQYRFTPARLNGALVSSWASVPFQFRIPSTPPTTRLRPRSTTFPPIVVSRDDKGGEVAVIKPEKIKSEGARRFSRIVRPKCPDVAKLQHAIEDVAVAVTIDEMGDVSAVSSESNAHDDFVNAALAAAAKCKFIPAHKNGQPVESSAYVHYLFTRDKPDSREVSPAGTNTPDLTEPDSLRIAGDSLFESAERSLTRGNLTAAEGSFNSLVRLENISRGYVGLGKISLAREDWAAARHQLDKALELDPTNTEAHYYAAISYRESGRSRWSAGQTQGISIELASARSMENFEWLLHRDSTYLDVLYQYSLLMKNEERYGDAMSALSAQIRLKPDLPIAWTGLKRLIRAAIHWGRAADLHARLQSTPEGLELYVHAEELRIRGLLDEAERTYEQLLAKPTSLPSQFAYLSLARIYARRAQIPQLEENYWRAVRAIKNEPDAALVLDDLKYILSPRELFEFPGLSVEQKRVQFFAAAWSRRNPTLASPTNPRLYEHYQRLVYAEENYYLDRERFSYYYDLGRPGLDFDFTDMGRVYVRQGPPDQTLREGGFGSTSESWIYNSTDESPEMVFQFYGASKSFSAGSLGSQAPTLNPGQPYSPWSTRSAGATNIPAAAAKKGLLPDPTETDLRVKRPALSELVFWDPNYYELWRATSRDDGDVVARAARRIAENRSRSVVEAMTTERYNPAKSVKILDLAGTISAFRAGTGNSVLEVAYVIPAATLLKESGDTLHPMGVETGFAIYDRYWRKIVSVAETVQVSGSSMSSDAYYRLHQTQVKPDSYYVAVYAQPLTGSVLAKSERKVFARDFWKSGLSISDLQLAFEIRKADEFSMFDKEGLRVVVNPLGRQAINRAMYVYFELYNVTEIAKGKSDLGLELSIRPAQSGEGVLSRVLGLFGGEKKGYFVTSEVERWKSDRSLAKYLVMDVTRMQPGRYMLEITVTDKPAKKSVSRTLEFELVGK